MNRRGFLQRLLAAPLAPAVASGIIANWPVAAVVAPVTVMHQWGLMFEVTETALDDDEQDWLAQAGKSLAFNARRVEEMRLANCFEQGGY